MAEYLTDLNLSEYKILQDSDDYAFSQDSVFLANIAKIGKDDCVLDLGCGCGILATLALIKKQASYAVGIEIQPRVSDMAMRSAQLNKLDDKLQIICGDVRDIRTLIKAESFDKVLCNPPYFSNNTSSTCYRDSQIKTIRRAIARSEGNTTLEHFVAATAYALRFGGDAWFIVKADRHAQLIYELKAHSLEPKHITLIYPKLSRGVDTIILCARKGGKVGVDFNTLIVMNEQGEYTKQAKELYH